MKKYIIASILLATPYCYSMHTQASKLIKFFGKRCFRNFRYPDIKEIYTKKLNGEKLSGEDRVNALRECYKNLTSPYTQDLFKFLLDREIKLQEMPKEDIENFKIVLLECEESQIKF